jgi:hypothetical protein
MPEPSTTQTDETPSTLPAVPAPGALTALAAAMATPSDMFERLRCEQRLAWLPTATTATSAGLDLWMHEAMLHGVATSVGVVPLALGIGAAGTMGATAATAAWLKRKQAAEALPATKRLVWTAAAAGTALTLWGANPLILGGYGVLALVGTAAWHKLRFQARRALRRALRGPAKEGRDQVAGPAPAMTRVSIGADGVTGGGAVELVADPIGEMVDIAGRWAEGVAKSGPLAGTTLLRGQIHDDGRISFIVDAGTGGIDQTAANAASGMIASKLRLALPDAEGNGGQGVLFDQPGGMGLDRGQLRMQIVQLAAVAAKAGRVTEELLTAPGKPYTVAIGPHVDDATPAWWDLADGDGVHGGAIVAGTRLGKSSLVDALAYRAKQLGFQIAFCDPQGGASSPVLAKYADFVVLGADTSWAMRNFLEDACLTREEWCNLHGVGKCLPGMIAPCAPGGRNPDPDCPCRGVVPPPMLAFMEECDQSFQAVIPGSNVKQGVAYGKLAKKASKLGIALVIVTQNPDLSTFGGSDMLRSNVAVRNLLAMHVSSNTSGTLIPGLPYSPKLLPKIAGRALMCGQASRVMQVCLDWMPRREDSVRVDGPYAEDLFEALPKRELYAPDLRAAAKWLPHAEGAQEAARASSRAKFATLMKGISDAPDPAKSIPTQRFSSVPEAAGQAASAPGQPSRTGSVPSFPEPVIVSTPMPRAEPAGAAPTMTAPAPTTLAGRLLVALASLDDQTLVTVSELAALANRIDQGDELAIRRARARDFGAELRQLGVDIDNARRTARGVAMPVAEVRTALESHG